MRSFFMNGLPCRPFFYRPAKQFSEIWPKSVFEIVVRGEGDLSVDVPNGVSDVPIGMSQSYRCCDTVKAERVAATNGGRRQLVHKMFTNTHPAFCRENVRCKVKGG